MIIQSFVGNRPKESYLPPVVIGKPHMPVSDWQYEAYAKKHGLPVDEVKRRDGIIKEHYLNCRVIKGTIVTPKTQGAQREYGNLKIVGVCKSIFDYGHTKWPKDDNPLIVSATPDKGKDDIICTTNFFEVSPALGNHGGSC